MIVTLLFFRYHAMAGAVSPDHGCTLFFIKRSNNNGNFIYFLLQFIDCHSLINGFLSDVRQCKCCQSKYGSVFFQRLYGTGFLRLCVVWTIKTCFVFLLSDVFRKQFGQVQ